MESDDNPSSTAAVDSSVNVPKRLHAYDTKTGGIYIPPFKLVRLQREVAADDSVEYQRQQWDRLKRRINAIVNKLTIDNIPELVGELLDCNVIRGRGIFARSWIRAQMASPGFTHIYAALLAVVNSKFPEIGELVIKRIILAFRRAYRRNDRLICLATVKSIAHLVNQKVAHEVMALELLAILLQQPTDDSVQLAVDFIIDVGATLLDVCKPGLEAIFERLRVILASGDVDKKTQYSIEKVWEARRVNFKDSPALLPQLDLVEQADQTTHDIDLLDETLEPEEMLNVFQAEEPNVYRQEERKWNKIKRTLLGIESSNDRDDDGENGFDGNSGTDADSDSSQDSELEDCASVENGEDSQCYNGNLYGSSTKEALVIRDSTEQALVNLRKTVYLCIMSSLNHLECVHKLLKLNIPEGRESEVCTMLVDCCAMERTFQQFYALQAERLCKLRNQYRMCFEECFAKQYQLIHRLDTAKLRNTAKFFAHLLSSEALAWGILAIIVLTEKDTTSSGRIFVKIILQTLAHDMGMQQLVQQLHEPETHAQLSGLFPQSDAKHLRFAINFYTAIGLGALTIQLRKRLEQLQR